MAAQARKGLWSYERYSLLMGALALFVAGLSLFNRETSGVAIAAVIGISLVGRRIVQRHNGPAKRDILLILVVVHALFAGLALAVSVLHEEDRWITALALSFLNTGVLWFDRRASSPRHGAEAPPS